jgi:hypothetical protein
MRGLKKAVFLLLFCLSFLFLRSTLYLAVGEAFRSASGLALASWALFQPTPWASTYGNECLALSRFLEASAQKIASEALKIPPSETIPASQVSWYRHRESLSQIPAPTEPDKQLLTFLQKRWLAKANGFYTTEIDLICPAFGYSVQVNPATTNCYARDPGRQTSKTYLDRMNVWKQKLPQPESFPLILTRPFDVKEYLPPHLEVHRGEEIKWNGQKIIDLTEVLPENSEEWLKTWETYKTPLSILGNEVICIQRLKGEGLGGIRILSSSEKAHRYLLDWVSEFGITANLIELDRCPFSSIDLPRICANLFVPPQTHPDFATLLKPFKSTCPETDLMVQGALTILKGLFDTVPKEKWNGIYQNPTRAGIANLALSKIEDELKLLENKTSFLSATPHLEEIFAHISNLLEIAAPFSSTDFGPIYLNQLHSIPAPLKSLTACSIHSCAMASVAGIFKAVEKLHGTTPRIIYGENTYFECIGISESNCQAVSIEKATDQDWKEANLILAQFNPVLKRTEPEISSYRRENILATIHKALDARQGKPFTVAIDCTIDLIDSPQVGQVLEAFQQEIETGLLNIVCYKSGLKFDLFGMDNYAGAPFYMVHNQDPKWAPFDLLIHDPSLLTDRLSASWFCLAYKYATANLDQYRQKIFENTRLLLNAAPARLFSKSSEYRIIPVEPDALPSFIDIRTSGPIHKFRSCALVGGYLYLKCMQEGHPIFYRRTFGLYHPNFGMIFGDASTTARLTLGLDPAQVELFVECLREIDALNGD